jgi:hypothetical protein
MRVRSMPDPAPNSITDASEPFAQASRHEDQLLTARVIPEDPYTAWLDQRERERQLRGIEGASEARG